ncbi:MAG: hypothetical protein JXA73_04590 [Acidobacteria bacterium]|nr:hypothetical protein [Acidobacteriota bacterium]
MDALALADGRLVSWSWDKTLRLWDGQSGACLAVLEGHTKAVEGVLALDDGQLLSWSEDNTFRLWNDKTGSCLEVVSEKHADQQHPEWHWMRAKATLSRTMANDFYVSSENSRHASVLRHKACSSIFAAWHAESHSTPRSLYADGTSIATQNNGQVCILKLHHGRRRVSLSEAEVLI